MQERWSCAGRHPRAHAGRVVPRRRRLVAQQRASACRPAHPSRGSASAARASLQHQPRRGKQPTSANRRCRRRLQAERVVAERPALPKHHLSVRTLHTPAAVPEGVK